MWCMFERCALFNCLERFKKNDKGRAERRNENGLTKKQQELVELKTNVERLKNQGHSLRVIAKELNISLGKVQRVLKK